MPINLNHTAAAPRRSRWRQIAEWLFIGVGTTLLLIGALFALFGIVVGRVPEYRVQVQDWLGDRTGLVVEFRALSARMRIYGPELVFDDAIVRTPDRLQVLATAERGSVGFDLWSSLRNGQLSAGRFTLASPQISFLRTRDGRIQLVGQGALPQRTEERPIAVEHVPTGRFEVQDAVVTFRDEFTGRGPWSMSGISFDLRRDTGSARLVGHASLPRGLGEALKFSANAEGGLQDPRSMVSSFTIEGEQLDLDGWADVFPDEWPVPETGDGSLKVSGTLRGPSLVDLSAQIDFQKLSAALPVWTAPLPTAQPMHADGAGDSIGVADAVATPAVMPAPTPPQIVSYERIAFNAKAKNTDGRWELQVNDLDIARTDAPWRAESIRAQWHRDEAGRHLQLTADRLVLENLWPLIAYLPESPQLARLRALQGRGTLNKLNFDLVQQSQSPASFTVQAELDNLGFEPIERAPGIRGISGAIHGDESGGELKLRAKDLQFTLPRMFREVLSAQSAEGDIGWSLDDKGITVQSDSVRVVTADGKASGSVHSFVPRDGTSPILKLQATGEDLNVAATGKYTPGHRLGKKTLEWFDRAFTGGRILNATFAIDGPTRNFPFREDEGTFNASAQVRDATLVFHENWLPATHIDAELTFENESMTAKASAAQVGEMIAQSVTARIADFKENELRVSAVSTGDLHSALEFLKASPLAEALGPQLQAVDGEGGLIADVNLILPIKEMEKRDVTVSARIANATVTHADLDAPVQALQGSLRVRNSLLASADMHGRWLNGPLTVSVRAQGSKSSTLTAIGRTEASRLKALSETRSSVEVGGPVDWRLTTALYADSKSAPPRSVHLSADVSSTAIGLPAPVGKLAGEPRLLELDATMERADRLLARASFGSVRALLSFREVNGAWRLDRGGVRADAMTASLPAHRGLRLEGTIQHFVLDDWLALRGEGAGRPLSETLHAANVRVGTFEAFGYRWTDVRGILQAAPSGWRVDVTGPQAEGQILIPESFTGATPLRATMEHLVLNKAPREGTKRESEASDPRKLPALDLHVSELRMDARSIGAIDVTATRLPQGLQFDQIRISGEASTAEGRGLWLTGEQGERSSLAASISSTDVAATLASLDYTPFLEAERGEIRVDLSWPGGFDDNILESATGRISVQAQSGQIVNLQPGAGRVLGLFSVAALPRRLALDFSDLTDKGLAFDSIHGDFELRDGNAFTNNLLLRGPAAEIGIAGRTGFGARDYDQTAVVTGNLGASLPVAGALAGGPAVGAALLLFSQVFKEPLKGMTRGYYRITGPWDNPHVERVDAADAKDASARTSRH